MSYDAASISSHFDRYGAREWDRLTATPLDEINLHIHLHILRQYVSSGMRVLEIGAGAGRFTQALAEIGARVVVGDISPTQVALNRKYAARFGFAQAVDSWHEVDICDLSRFADASFDCVIAYGGPFSYVLDQRDLALRECLRVLRPGGRLLASVMLQWGSARRSLDGVLNLPPEVNQRVIRTGDLTGETIPDRSGHFMHMFRAAEVRDWLSAKGLKILSLSASGVLASGVLVPDWEDALRTIRQNETQWNELLRMEREASAEPGCLDMGTHLIFVVDKPPR